jgi:hypothetical protein
MKEAPSHIIRLFIKVLKPREHPGWLESRLSIWKVKKFPCDTLSGSDLCMLYHFGDISTTGPTIPSRQTAAESTQILIMSVSSNS